jgi:hypothetical protein
MADLRSRYLDDYAGGFLNIARQEISSTGEVLVQDGFTSEGTLFVEDGVGVKSGLLLGSALAEAVDPTTETGIVNVRFADRTYAKIRDLKIFSTAIASAQAALSEATSISITNLESTLQILEDDVTSITQTFQNNLENGLANLATLNQTQAELSENFSNLNATVTTLSNKITELESKSANTVVDLLSTDINSSKLVGTISITAGTVTGVNTNLSGDLDIGDIIYVPFLEDIASPAADPLPIRLQQFRIIEFDTSSPNTAMLVTPTNVNVPAGSYYYKAEVQELKTKMNEVISVLKSLNFVQ